REGIERRFPDCSRFPVMSGSDAHHPDDIGKRFTWLTVESVLIGEIKKALRRQDGRMAEC
ncbi:MAG TPA: PHP-associated domain-containing protein, partial [Nitrospirota bacterium]|nr:PHP-associated domain-containing protein [Nitrospirota bacterium]